ncbi:MAG: FGGY-family carbohydrate kinase [Treponema sp.]|jgi:sugar (pentulose or hexulose) kinase|nr:FGGY-family carbohydrate kinase [Treponema sp.]
MNILALDFGTSSVKLSLLGERAAPAEDPLEILCSAKEGYQIRVLNEDWVELDAEEVFSAMIRGLEKLRDRAGEGIDLIAYDVFSPSLIFMDREGNPLYPILTHLDRRSKKQSAEILQRMGKDRFQAVTGIQPFTGGVSITSALWVRENEEAVFNRAERMGHLNTYLYKKLTGLWACDPVNASQTGLYETVSGRGWSEEIAGLFGIPLRLLPGILPAGAAGGRLSPEAARLCGLKPGIPVALGTNDAASAQVGAGNTRAGAVLNISGSSEMISVLSAAPRIDDRYYLRCSATPGLWQIYATTAGGFALDWFRKEFYRDLGDRDFFEKELPGIAEDLSFNIKGVEFLPYLSGDRQSITPKKGAFTGLTLETRRENLLAALLRGMHEPIKQVLAICEEFMPLERTIKLTGGMIDQSMVKIKKQILPAYGFEVKKECMILGSALLALGCLKGENHG